MEKANMVTKLFFRFYSDKIYDFLEEIEAETEPAELSCKVSESFKEKVNEQLIEVEDGFVSELIHMSYEEIDFDKIVAKLWYGI